jgi:hypothetical protein
MSIQKPSPSSASHPGMAAVICSSRCPSMRASGSICTRSPGITRSCLLGKMSQKCHATQRYAKRLSVVCCLFDDLMSFNSLGWCFSSHLNSFDCFKLIGLPQRIPPTDHIKYFRSRPFLNRSNEALVGFISMVFNITGWGPRWIAFSCLVGGWILWFMVDIIIVDGGYNGL